MIDWVRQPPTDGFKWLVNRGLSKDTTEYLVVKHAEQFPSEIDPWIRLDGGLRLFGFFAGSNLLLLSSRFLRTHLDGWVLLRGLGHRSLLYDGFRTEESSRSLGFGCVLPVVR